VIFWVQKFHYFEFFFGNVFLGEKNKLFQGIVFFPSKIIAIFCKIKILKKIIDFTVSSKTHLLLTSYSTSKFCDVAQVVIIHKMI
jgi:hypothetical protein